MNIKGFQGTSLLDYPGHIASIVFFGGCNLTCPFCHNPSLVLEPQNFPSIPPHELLEELEERRTFIDGVVISGGEPTASPDIIPFLEGVKSLGFSVKLDTNGLLPRVLHEVLSKQLADYVALDVKTSPERYGELHSKPVDISALKESVGVLLSSSVEYEFRTTCVPAYVTREDVLKMGDVLCGGRLWVFQQFVPSHALDEGLHGIDPYRADEVEALAEPAKDYVREVRFRGL